MKKEIRMTEDYRVNQLKEVINKKRYELNNRVLEGIDSDVIALSQELDELITIYTKHQLDLFKK